MTLEEALENESAPRRKMKGWRLLAWRLFTLACIGGLVWYVLDHREDLEAAFSTSTGDLLALVVLVAIGQWLNGTEFWFLYRADGVPVGLFEYLQLYNAGQLGNYLPLQMGSAYRLRYLKTVHGVRYASGASALAINVVISFGSTAVAGIIGVIGYATIEGNDLAWIMLLAFVGLLAVAVGASFVPLPSRLVGHKRIQVAWAEFHRSWESLRKKPKVALVVLVIDVVKLALLAFRFQVAFSLLGVEDSWFLFFVLGPVAALTTVLAPTPGGIGLREAAVAGSASAMGSSIPTGLLAATVDRAVLLVVTLVLGSIGYLSSSVRLRRARDAPPGQPVQPGQPDPGSA